MLRALLQFVAVTGVAALAALMLVTITDIQRISQEVAYVRPQSIEEIVETPLPAEETAPIIEKTVEPAESQPAAAAQSQSTGNEVYRVKNPYDFEPKSDAELYTIARSAIVNIYCRSSGKLGSISGSGVVIDPRGVILTNAHVAQYMLLATEDDLHMECFIRTGSPSQNRYTAELLYLPAAWIQEHAADIAAKRPKGTGEHDYALLAITKTVDGSPLPTSLPYLATDVREAVAFAGDKVLLAGYPAEFAIQGSRGTTLYPTSVFTRVGELFTFADRSVDLLSLGGAILAQSGSSGGAVINEWGRLVGIISTTSAGSTTAERELRAVTLSYINRDVQAQTGADLSALLVNNPQTQASLFMATEAPTLASTLVSFLP